MTLLKRYRFHLVVTLGLLALLAASARTRSGRVTGHPQNLPKINKQGQFDQAIELLPRGQRPKLLAAQQAGKDLRPFIYELVRQSLPAADRHRAYDIARTVITEANHYDMDPLFLLAVITTESQFRIKARGSHGEIGLMQVLPSTAAWLADAVGLPADQIDLEDPCINIRVGASYFANLRKSFGGRGVHYVSAYNMGSRNVRRLIASNVEPKIYSSKVLGNYRQFYGTIQQAYGVAGRSLASVSVATTGAK